MTDIIKAVEQAIGNVVHHTHNAIDAAVAEVKKDFETEKTVIATEVRQAVADVVNTVKADAPEIEAAIKKGAADALAALEAVLKARGL